MNQFESRFDKMIKKTEPTDEKIPDSLNKDISLFQDALTQNISTQLKKEWKKLSKDSKISLLLQFCNQENISNFDYLKKYLTKLDVDYDLEKMLIVKIKNIIKIEKPDNSTFELQIINLKTKNTKKNTLNNIESELVEDI